jgi:hypothetical protein
MALQVISQSKEPEIDRSLLKIIFLGFFTVGFVFLAVYFFSQYLLLGWLRFFWGTIAAAAAALSLNILNVFFVKSRAKLNLIIFLESLAPLVIFWNKIYPTPSKVLLGGAAVFFVFLLIGASRSAKLLANGLKIQFWFTAKPFLTKAVSGFLIFLSVIFYLYYFQWGKFNDVLGQKFLDVFLVNAEPFLRFQLGNVSFRSSMDDFLKEVAETQLKRIKLTISERSEQNFEGDFANLPPELKKQAIEKASLALKENLEKTFGPLDSKKEVRIIIYEIIKKYFENLRKQFKLLWDIGIVIIFFFTLKGLAALFNWLIIFIAFVLYKLAIVTGFAYVTLESRSREFILLS